jgi:hypothetical protein
MGSFGEGHEKSRRNPTVNNRIPALLLSAALLAVPAVATAKDHGQKHAKQEHKSHGKKGKHAKKVTYVFKGTFTAPGTVAVTSGNAHVRKGGFVGQAVTFDLAAAKIVVADTNGDGERNLADVKDGDKVLVQARAAKRTKYAAPAEGETAAALIARKLVDQAAAESGDDVAETEHAPETESD